MLVTNQLISSIIVIAAGLHDEEAKVMPIVEKRFLISFRISKNW